MEGNVISHSVSQEFVPEFASPGKRFGNYIIDLIICYILYLFFTFCSGIVAAVVNPEAMGTIEEDLASFSTWFFYIFHFLYYILMEGSTGSTFGKLITQTKVVDKYGKKPDFKTVMLRSLCRFVPFDAFSFLGPIPVGWHDSWSDTYVVMKK